MIIISAIVLFLIIYFAVRLAINPLLHQHKDHNPDNYEGDLVKLRDMDILSNYELEEIAELYEKNKKSTADYEQY